MCKRQKKGFNKKKNELVCNKRKKKVSHSAKRQECFGKFWGRYVGP